MKRLLPLVLILVAVTSARADEPTRAEVESTMRAATDFMYSILANRGGFVWLYTMDLEPYGELKARDSMIWVEPPGTPSVGLMLLEAYRATGDPSYLEQAAQSAEALAKGQHPSGGWHYFIDFDPQGLQRYHEDFFAKCWGWQEYLKFRHNATFDDYCTTESTRFFLRLYQATGNAAHKAVLDKAIQFILDAQLASGGWPQRYPIEGDDYSRCATFNDDVTADCIDVLLEAFAILQDERCNAAARRGMDFCIRSQLPAPQAGWAQQYDADMKPAWGRPFEIGTVCSTETYSNIVELMKFYSLTGDAKYLEPIPSALDWLDSARLPASAGCTHTMFYEMETNRPIYIKQTGTTIDDVNYAQTYEAEGAYPYGDKVNLDVDGLRKQYAMLRDTAPAEAKRVYEENEAAKPLPKQIRGGYLATTLAKTDQSPAGIAAICASRDARGGWRDEVTILDPFSPFTAPPQKFEAYVTGGYIGRMYRLINYLDTLNEAKD